MHIWESGGHLLGLPTHTCGNLPRKRQLACTAETKPPTNTTEVLQKLGICNFFWVHVLNFAQISAPLTELTRNDCPWKAGVLPR